MDVSEVALSGSGTILIGQVSPVKSSKKRPDIKYFEGQISDDVKTMQLVSFEPTLRCKVEEAQKTKRSVALQNCSLREATTMITLKFMHFRIIKHQIM